MDPDGVLFECDTEFGHYQIADTVYCGRPARMLYSGNNDAAQSGVAKDNDDDLLFDYNQRFRELVQGMRPKRVLILGGGAFTLPTALMQEFPGLELDVVELDGSLVDLARRYFGFQPDEHTTVFIGDGRRFLEKTDRVYDLIIMDVFTHAVIPLSFQNLETALGFRRCLGKNGIVAINIIASLYGPHSVVLRRMHQILQATFRRVHIFPAGQGLSSWISQNYVMTAQDSHWDLSPCLRYPAVGPSLI